MSIRKRLVILCLVLALLPAVPLSLLVQNLLDKSFNVGLNPTISEALESGISVSRSRIRNLKREFDSWIIDLTARNSGPSGGGWDPGEVSRMIERSDTVDGVLIADEVVPPADSYAGEEIPGELKTFEMNPLFRDVIRNREVKPRQTEFGAVAGLAFYETGDLAVQLALLREKGRNPLLFYRRVDPEFIHNANRILQGKQIFAQLRLTRERLNRSFFYPFMIIYGVILAVSLIVALIIAERLARPVRKLASATSIIAGGDWGYRLRQRAGGEIGDLIESFNSMVSRLQRQQRRLTDMEKMASWRDIARNLAHEVKNPLLPIRLTVQEMRDQYGGGDDKYGKFLRESVRVVEDELEHLRELVREFSAFARMPGLKLEKGSPGDLARDVASLYPGVETSVESEGVSSVVFDHHQMRRVLVNLYDNTVGAAGKDDEIGVDIRISAEEDYISMVFSDNGPGIPEDRIERVFEPRFTTRKGGSGLGLAMVKNIILLHGGTIEAQNRRQGGVSFVIRLPYRVSGNNNLSESAGEKKIDGKEL